MDLDSLKTFLAITETGSFTSAGHRVGRTQSAVSQQIKKMEDRLGRTLLDRRGGQVSLTEDGRKLLPYAREMLNLEERVLGEFTETTTGGRITLGIPELYTEYLLPKIIPEFQAQFPNVEVSLTHNESPFLLKTLQEGALDLTLYTDLEGGRVGPDKLFTEDIAWIGPQHVRLEDQEVLPVVMWREGSNYRRIVLSTLERAGRAYRVAMTTQSVSGMLAAIAAGVGVGCVTPINFSPRLRVIDPVAGLPPIARLTLFLDRGRSRQSAAAKALGDHIVQVGRVLAEELHPAGQPL